MVLWMRRCEMVGVKVASACGCTAETSCTTSRLTTPLALIRGVTLRMTPVSFNSTLLTNGAFGGFMQGAGGDDILTGGIGGERLEGAGGADILNGGLGGDTIEGGLGDDIVIGGDGDDFITGNEGADDISGGAGTDRITADLTDHVDGGDGVDILTLDLTGDSSPRTLDLAVVVEQRFEASRRICAGELAAQLQQRPSVEVQLTKAAAQRVLDQRGAARA